MSFYAVANGRTIGLFLNWNDCNNSEKIILLKEFIEELKTQLSNKFIYVIHK
jgi:hypothetical protein